MTAWVFWLSVFAIVYVYFGYPLLLGFLAALRPPLPDFPAYTPPMTLLIAAYNEEKMISAKLENSLELDYPAGRLQILVAADGSDDGTVAIVRKYRNKGVQLSFEPERRGKMSAINRAMKLASGKIVVFSDANNFYDHHTLKFLAAPFSIDNVGAVIGAKTVYKGDSSLGESESAYWRYESWIKEQETRLGHCTGAVGEILAIRRELYDAPPEKIINDDFYILMQIIRKGWRTVYAPKARSSEHISLKAQDEINRRARINAGRCQAIALARFLVPWQNPLVVWQVISHKFLRPLLPIFMILVFLSNFCLLVFPIKASGSPLWNIASPFNWMFFFSQIFFYMIAWLGNLINGRGKIATLIYIPTYIVNSNMAALWGLLHYLSGRHTPIWTRAER